ncbi:MAG: phytoene desaturase [Candidatus Omnitrophica bacterium]|nr:phytoene desaturase [Candidatus Omnitrophota bacterium]
MSEKIAVIGAGVGGLSTAARLANRGYQVEVFEKLPACGGRNNLLEDKGFKFDMGPSFVLMPDFFEEVFSYCKEEMRDYLDLRILECGYKIFYSSRDTLTVYRDSKKTKEQLEKIEKGAGMAFDGFIKETARLYKCVRPLLYRCFTKGSALNPSYWGLIKKIRFFESYWDLAAKFFKDERLRYAFTFEAMFMGVSPFDAPAFYSVISYADHVQKIFHPMGGMYRIPLSLEKIAKKYGARFYYGREVKNILSKGNTVKIKIGNEDAVFDKVVVNADYAYAQSELLKRKIPKYKYSCSVYLIYLGLKKKVKGFAHHNLFFSKDLKRNLKNIFTQKLIPEDPSFYVHVPTVTDESLAPKNKEIFYILIPVPNLEGGDQTIEEAEESLRRVVFEKINGALGERLQDLIEVEHRFYPRDFIDRYNIKYGATFGLAHNLMQSAFFRPANFDSKIKNLYFTGASTQPGGGLPVVMASSRIVADLIC